MGSKTKVHANLYRIGGVGLCHTSEIHLMVGLVFIVHAEVVDADPSKER